MTKHVLVSAFLLCGGVLVASSQTPAPPAQPRMPDMMQQHHEMMAEMKASDARLEELVRAMNAANGEAKVSAMPPRPANPLRMSSSSVNRPDRL